jgi:hypothetical protein
METIKRLQQIRDALAVRDSSEKEKEQARKKHERGVATKVRARIYDGLEIVKQEWGPFLQDVRNEVYDTGMFNEVLRFWDKFPVDFTYETCNWTPKKQAYIPIYHGGVRVYDWDILTTHLLYATPQGFTFRAEFSNSNSRNWRGFKEALSLDRLLKIGEFPGLNILSDMKRLNEEKVLSLTSPNVDRILRYSSPFFLIDAVDLTNTGEVRDIIGINPARIRRKIKEGVKQSKESYAERVQALLEDISQAVHKKEE